MVATKKEENAQVQEKEDVKSGAQHTRRHSLLIRANAVMSDLAGDLN